MYLLKPYDDALQEILDNGIPRTNQRTGIKTLSIFGMCKRYRLDTEFFPIVTRRKMWPSAVFSELVWFLSGSTNNNDLKELGCNFWTPWISEKFTKENHFEPDVFGPVYGFQLRHFGGNYNKGIHQDPGYGFHGIDQLAWAVEEIKRDPSSRRIVWSLWNPQDLPQMRLPPCHLLLQLCVDDSRKMTGILYQRSADFPIGVPANIQFYSALVTMLSQQTDCTPYELVHMTADSHIYENQIDAVKEYLGSPVVNSPRVLIKQAKDIFSYCPEDFIIQDYNCGPKIEVPVSV